MKQITKTIDINSINPMWMNDITGEIENESVENLTKRIGGTMKILDRRFKKFREEYRIASQLEIRA